MRNHSLLALTVCCLAAGCTNYDFRKAMTTSGEFDVPKLIEDLKTSGRDQLSSGTWIPLIYLDLTTFKASSPLYPPGYTLQQMTCVGPIFCGGATDVRVMDEKGVSIESNDLFWLGWGVLFYDHDQRIETPSGPRLQERRRLALLFGKDETVYRRPQP